METVFHQILIRGVAGISAKTAQTFCFADMSRICQFFDGERAAVIRVDHREQGADPLIIPAGCGGSGKRMQGEEGQPYP